MAVGIARMFGIILPVNFYSPYKANNIIEFWRRWHVTLSRFLRTYLYIPLGGNRKGSLRKYTNIMITMLLGGLWHGAGWTFVIWGGMHGLFIIINHGWIAVFRKLFPGRCNPSFFGSVSGRLVTFTSVLIAWVMFRAESVSGALNIYSGMFGFHGISLPVWAESKLGSISQILTTWGFSFEGMFFHGIFGNLKYEMGLLVPLLLIVWFFPNTFDWLKNQGPALNLEEFQGNLKEKTKLVWQPNLASALIVTSITVLAIMFIQKESEFLYFQF